MCERDMRERITDAVFQLMETRDIPEINVVDAVAKAGISRSSFYRYFNSVDHVVKAFEETLLQNMREINEVALLSGYGKEELTATPFMIARMRLLAKNRDRIVVLNGQHGDPVFTHKATVLMHDLFRERMHSFFKEPMDLEFYLAFVLAGHHNMIQFWLEKMPEVAPEKTAAYLNLLFNAGLFISQTELSDCPSFAAKARVD